MPRLIKNDFVEHPELKGCQKSLSGKVDCMEDNNGQNISPQNTDAINGRYLPKKYGG